VLIIASDDLLRISSAGRIIETLLELHDLLIRKRKCKIMWPSYEGNLYSGTLAGVHPGLLPGFHSVTDKKGVEKWSRIWNTSLHPAVGLSGKEMTQQIGNDGITAMIVVGDIPADERYADLEFLVQINTHMTRLSQYAHLLLPVTDFLENNGHLLGIDGRLKRLNTVVRRPGMVKSIAGIISGFASSVHAEGFPSKASDVYREIRSSIEIPGKNGKSGKSISGKAAFADPSTSHAGAGSADDTNSHPVTLQINHNHFRYRGNYLGELVPDLHSVIRGNMISLSDPLMKRLDVREGEQVRVTSPYGTLESAVRSIPELKGETALLCSNGNEPDCLHSGNYPESLLMNVKIEKI
jgi:predicted molibdopterin-dependent oxidoreductase YjgC